MGECYVWRTRLNVELLRWIYRYIYMIEGSCVRGCVCVLSRQEVSNLETTTLYETKSKIMLKGNYVWLLTPGS